MNGGALFGIQRKASGHTAYFSGHAVLSSPQPARTPGENFGTRKLTFVPAPGAVSTTSP